MAERAPTPDVLHTEHEFNLQIGSATVVGRIDRIDRLSHDRVVIVDYKTGRPRTQEDADESLQLSIYACAARESFGYESERLAFYNLETDARLALGELQLKSNSGAGRLTLTELLRDVQGRGFGLIARRAQEALAANVVAQSQPTR